MRNRWLITVVFATLLGAVATAVSGVALNVATSGTADWFPTMKDHHLRWLAGSVTTVAAAGVLLWWAQQRYAQSLVTLIPATQRPEAWVVRRPRELSAIVRALTRRRGAATVGITTAVHGAGGFGKTTVARMVRAHPRVLRRFGGRVYWVTLGRDVRRGGTLIEKVNDLVRQVDPARAHPYTDVRQAAEHLASVLAGGPRRLIILDDVWFDDQLAAFPVAGGCARLVTTRNEALVGGQDVPVEVDQMSPEQAGRVLTADLPAPLPDAIVDALLRETGKWPLLLRLVNKVLVDQARARTDVVAGAQDLLAQLRRDGPLQVDELSGASTRKLDVNDPDQRDGAVRATIEAGTGLLSGDEHRRFAELAVFAEDEIVPLSLVATLWGADDVTTRAWCARLADLALLTLSPTASGGTISLHDVIRDYLAESLGADAVARLHGVLLDAVRGGLPGGVWWALPADARYLQEHLVEHLLAAGRPAEAEALVLDLRWAVARVAEGGPAGLSADLSAVESTRTARLGRRLDQIAHLLGATDPAHNRVDVFLDRMAGDSDWGRQARTMLEERRVPRLVSTWTVDDRPSSALRRSFSSDFRWRSCLAITPDGRRLVAGGDTGKVHVWDVTTGKQQTALLGRKNWTEVLAIAPDCAWFVTTNHGVTVRLWELSSGRPRATLSGWHWDVTHAVAAPDGSWIAVVNSRKSVRVFDTATGRRRFRVTRGRERITAMAAAPDSTWFAFGTREGTVTAWDARTGTERSVWTRLGDEIRSIAIAPDGTWLALATTEEIQIREAGTGRLRRAISAFGLWGLLAITPDGTRLLAPGFGDSIDVWDVATGRPLTTLAGHTGIIEALATAPDGSWFATSANDHTVRLWDADATAEREDPPDTGSAASFALAAGGTWFAALSPSGGIEKRNAVTGERESDLADFPRWSTVMAIAPDDSWMAVQEHDEVQIWSLPDVKRSVRLIGHTARIQCMAVSPAGDRLATSSHEGPVLVWEVATGALITRLADSPSLEPRFLAISPDDGAIVIAEYQSVRTYDAESGRQLGKIKLGGLCAGMAIAPDGEWLATAADDAIRIWEPASGELISEFGGHTEAAGPLAASRDGRWLAMSGANGSIWVWDLGLRTIAAMTRVDSHLTTCEWSPDGRHLYVGGSGRVYRFEFRDRPD